MATSCATVDLRPDEAPIDEKENPEAVGRAWLAKAAEAQGGFDALKAAKTARFVFTDEWPGWLTRTLIRPWEGERMQLDARLGTDDGRVTFLDEDEGSAWGIHRWVTYRVDEDGRMTIDDVDDRDDGIAFWIPTTLYFATAAFRLGEASIAHFIGTRTIAGREHAGVFLSWNDAAPQDDIDQYIAWIDVETNILGWLEYTVRDYGGWVRGTMRFSDYRDVASLKVPYRLTIVEELGETEVGLHEYRIESAEVGLEWPDDYLYPSDRRATK